MEVKKSEIGELARAVLRYADKRCYGIGECGYYFKEWASDYTDQEDEEYIKALSREAEEYAWKLDSERKEYGGVIC